MKVCIKCELEKEISEFHKYAASKDGLYPRCKACRKNDTTDYYKKQRDSILEKSKYYREKNIEKVKTYQKEYHRIQYKSNKTDIDKRNKDWASKHAELVRKKTARSVIKFRLKNPERAKEIMKRYSDSSIKGLSNSYVKQIIREKGLSNPPESLMELQRNILKFKREIKNKQDGNTNTELRTKE